MTLKRGLLGKVVVMEGIMRRRGAPMSIVIFDIPGFLSPNNRSNKPPKMGIQISKLNNGNSFMNRSLCYINF